MIPLFRQASPAPAGLTAGALLGAFESLGDNCEFGIAQRYAGIDPLGLFRLSSAPIADLTHAVETRFAHYGGPGDIEVRVGAGGYLFCHSRRYGFAYHTGDTAPRTTPAAILDREVRRVAYLKERLLADLAAGDKILVRKGPPGESEAAVRRLLAALRAIGPATLLRVCAEDGRVEPGRVVWCGEGLMQGTLPHFAPYAAATDADLASWLAVCGRAYALRHSLVEPPPLAPSGPPVFSAPVRRATSCPRPRRSPASSSGRSPSPACGRTVSTSSLPRSACPRIFPAPGPPSPSRMRRCTPAATPTRPAEAPGRRSTPPPGPASARARRRSA